MRVSIPVLFVVLCGSLEAQYPLSHPAGLVVTVDFEGDLQDEFLLVDSAMNARSFLTSQRGSLEFRPGPSIQLNGDELLDLPVVHEGLLTIASPGSAAHEFQVTTYFVLPGGVLQGYRSHRYRALRDPVSTVRIAPFHRDLDGDGHDDVLMAWTETGNGSSAVYTRLHAPGYQSAPAPVPLPPLAPADTRVVSVHRSASPALRSDEYLLGFSAGPGDLFGGFGFGLVFDGRIPGPGVWLPLLPTLMPSRQPPLEDQPIAYGRFSPFPQFGVPVVKTFTGRSARLGLDPSEPFVARRGEVLRTTSRGKQLPQCTADYDGDGVDEMAWVEYLDQGSIPTLLVTDAGPGRRYVQAIPLEPTGNMPLFSVHHGAAGDFDGDGDPDIVLSVSWVTSRSGSGLVFLRNDRLQEGRFSALQRVR